MLGYSVNIAVLLIYLRSTNAQSTYITDTGKVNEELREEVDYLSRYLRYYGKRISSHKDVVCDKLRKLKKKSLCNKIMIHMINGKNDGVFESFDEADSSLAVPQLAVNSFSIYPYMCEKVYVETYGFEKRMYWCKPRRYKTESGRVGEMEGFFCATVLLDKKRVYAFRPPQLDSDSVEPVGELIGVDIFGNDTEGDQSGKICCVTQ